VRYASTYLPFEIWTMAPCVVCKHSNKEKLGKCVGIISVTHRVYIYTLAYTGEVTVRFFIRNIPYLFEEKLVSHGTH